MSKVHHHFRLSMAAGPALCMLLAAGLVARAEEEAAATTEVAVQVAQIKKTTLRSYVTGFGQVESAPALPGKPAGGARLSAGMSGLVSETLCTQGQRVEKGAVLMKLDARTAAAQVEKARQAVNAAQITLERQTKLRAADASSEKLLREAEAQVAMTKAELAAAETQLTLHQIIAPLEGTVTKVLARNGETVEAGTALVELADLNQLVVASEIPVAEAGRLRPGAGAEITAAGSADVLSGSLLALSPQVEAAHATVTAWIGLPAGCGLRLGQFASVRIVVEERTDRLAVPRASLYTDGAGKTTLSLVEGNIAKQLEVKAGLRDGELVEVEGDGLTDGATVVTAGSYALPEKTRVRILKSGTEEGAK